VFESHRCRSSISFVFHPQDEGNFCQMREDRQPTKANVGGFGSYECGGALERFANRGNRLGFDSGEYAQVLDRHRRVVSCICISLHTTM
jgi:hypothetical protein